ncbi:proton-conducting transporter membrane subunit [Legionella tucsonensis]|uniref:NADH-quinone oxidoreductase chain L n=1 Tax=Legionella tucsonensis TaxID=40335 RepID=A0A0W0ZPN9_9GAMM|nr:proton-conducting transporter membrane subunit [Legionella tucsonensis]KTD71205.1 NADH-quinone oxidoreductase chain L [Legionella tucsonensis]
MNWLPLLPLLTCFFVVILNCLFWSYSFLQKSAHLIGAILLLCVTGLLFYVVSFQEILVVQLGGYKAPFGITFVIDRLSAIMLLITGIIGFCVSIYATYDIKTGHQKSGFYLAYWILLMGICGAFSTGDLFNLYVWFEVMLIASFVLLVLGNHRMQLDGGMKYVSLNLVATILMLLAIAMLYAMVGTLNMADLGLKLKAYPLTGTVTTVVLLLAIAFAIKSALFPLFFWLPASYHTTNVTTAAIFAGMLTKVGVYALIRLTTLILPDSHYILSLLLFIAGLTMLTGVLGAASEFHFRRLLSFHIISQIGYMVMGLAIYTPFALAGAIFYIIHNIIAKTNLFLISGICLKIEKTSDIRKLGGFYKQYPYLAILFFISAFSLAGVPPLSGFWAKLILLKAALNSSHYIITAIALLVSLLTLYSMTKIWTQVFWKEQSSPSQESFGNIKLFVMLFPVIILAMMTLTIGLFPQPVFKVMLQAAEQISHPEWYIHAVLGVE